MNEKPHSYLTIEDTTGVMHKMTVSGSRTMCGRHIDPEPWRDGGNGFRKEWTHDELVTCIDCVVIVQFVDAGYRREWNGRWVKP